MRGSCFRIWPVLAIGSLALGLGCAESTGASRADSRASKNMPTTTADGLVKAEIDLPGALFIREDHGIGSYDAFVVPSVGVNYKRKSKQLKPEMEEELQTTLRDSLVEAAQAAEIPVLDKPGKCVMQVGLAVYNVNIARNPHASSLGTMTLVMEFRDSVSRQPLLRYAIPNQIANRQRSANRNRQLRKGFDEMVQKLDLATALRAAGLGDDQVRPGCNGLLAKLGRQAQQSVSAR